MMSNLKKSGFALVLCVGALGVMPSSYAADAVRGKSLYNNTNGAPLNCSSSGCHNGFPAVKQNKIANGSNPTAILNAIAGNDGGMGIFSAYVNATDAADIAAYIANPAAGDGSPGISLSPTSLSFGSQTLNTTSAEQTITVTNSGTAVLTFTGMTLTGANSGNFARTGSCTPTGSVAAGGNCTVKITFTPNATGNRSATLTLSHNAGAATTVALSGTGALAAASASVSPSTLSFTQTVGATSAAQIITVSNTGGQALTINSLTLGGANAGQYAITSASTCAANVVVNAGANCTIGVTFTPTATGTRNATLSIAHSASTTAATVALNGTGSSAAVPAISLSSSSLSFGNQTLSTSSDAQTVTLTNSGQADLNLTALTLSGSNPGNFARSGTCAVGTPVAVGGTCTLRFVFTPNAVGTRSATLTVASNASNGDTTLALSGTGVQFLMSVNPMSASLEGTVGKISAPKQTVISNSGASALNVSDINVSGPFLLQLGSNACGTPPFTLATGQSCNLHIAFKPLVAGAASGEVSVSSNASALPVKVTLSAQAQLEVGSFEDVSNMGLGGCSIGAPDQLVDPVLLALLALSLAVVVRRRYVRAKAARRA